MRRRRGSGRRARHGHATAPGRAATTSLVAVTACPTGIAHTYMAAEALEAAAARAGVAIAVETQGSAGSTPLAHETISQAGAVIFAVDVGVRDRSRFAGKPMVSSSVKRPIDDADAMIAEALRYAADPANAPRVEGEASAGGADHGAAESWGGRVRRVLMTGVSYMIPFVAAGGLLIALSFLLGGYEIVGPYGDIAVNNGLFNLPDPEALGLDHALFNSGLMAYLGALFFIIGKTAFALFLPALAGYIAYAIADRPGIAPGFVLGGLSANLFNVQTSDGVAYPATGFIGAMIGGVLAGIAAHWIASWKVPTWARGLMPVLVIPLFASVLAGLTMLIVLGKPISWLMDQLTEGLNSMSGGSAILLGIILGLMMAFDMGGPLNKVAYTFAAVGVGGAALANDAPELQIMAAVMLAGMVPPIALALATVVRPGLFNVRRAGERQGRLAAGPVIHHRGRHPVRRSRSAACDPRDHAGQRRDGRVVDGDGGQRAGAARRDLRAVRRRERPRLPHRPRGRRRRRSCRRHRPEVHRPVRRGRHHRLTPFDPHQRRSTHAQQVRRRRLGRRPARPSRRDHRRGR